MRFLGTSLLAFFSCGLAILMSGCKTSEHASRPYKPLPKWEAKFFSKARRDVLPNDVRERPDGFTNTLVAWSGVIKKIEFFTGQSTRVARITARHHYFDWTENNSQQRERFYMSPRGEGGFTAVWRAETAQDEAFLAQFAAGDMLIAYGFPNGIRDNVVGLHPTEVVRAIKPQWYRTDILEYGRPGEPTRVLKSPR